MPIRLPASVQGRRCLVKAGGADHHLPPWASAKARFARVTSGRVKSMMRSDLSFTFRLSLMMTPRRPRPVEFTRIQTDHGRARSFQRRSHHHALGVGRLASSSPAHTTITAHHGHTDRIVHLHPLISLLGKRPLDSPRPL